MKNKKTSKPNDPSSWLSPDDVWPTHAYLIKPIDGQKRLRVMKNQQTHDIIESLSPFNYLTEYARFMRGCDNLERCYPNYKELGYVEEIRQSFIEKYNDKKKKVIIPWIRYIRRKQIKKDLERMKMSGN